MTMPKRIIRRGRTVSDVLTARSIYDVLADDTTLRWLLCGHSSSSHITIVDIHSAFRLLTKRERHMCYLGKWILQIECESGRKIIANDIRHWRNDNQISLCDSVVYSDYGESLTKVRGDAVWEYIV